MSDNFFENNDNHENIFEVKPPAPRNTSDYQGDFSYIPDREPKKKKKRGFAKRVVSLVLSGILFGGVAGGAFVGVSYLGSSYFQNEADSSITTSDEAPVTPPVVEVSNTTPVRNAATLDVSDVVEDAMPAIVAITSTTVQQIYGFFGQTQNYESSGSGSGIIVGQNDTELLIATNNHVVADTTELTVSFIDDTAVAAVIKGTDSESDLAVIAVQLADIPEETLNQIKMAKLGNSDDIKVGQGVIAIGNALGYGQTVTVGYISALNKEVAIDGVTMNLLQTDAAINPGNSGGALLNMNGEVIGINSAKSSGSNVEGMGYAIPISYAEGILGDLMNKVTKVAVPEENRGYLGIQGAEIDQRTSSTYDIPTGCYVHSIEEGSPASQSELKEKDIITRFDGEKVQTISDIRDLLAYYEGGTTITLTVQRLVDGQYIEMAVDITLGYQPAAS